jgi:hypothetical protein
MRALLALVTLLSGCGSSISSDISRQAATGRVDLNNLAAGQWDRVCFLGPYSDNKAAERTLGFPWDAETRTDISSSDWSNVLIFVKGSEVIAYTEHTRRQDFSDLSGQCFAQGKATFAQDKGPGNRYVHVS